MVKVQVELYEPFYQFLKEYLDFFGNKQSLGDFIQQETYKFVRWLHGDLTLFAQDHRITLSEWFEKYPCQLHAEGKEDADC